MCRPTDSAWSSSRNTRVVVCEKFNVWKVILKPDSDLQYCNSGINKKSTVNQLYTCVYCYAYVSKHHSGSAAKAANGYYLHDHTYCQLEYCIVH